MAIEEEFPLKCGLCEDSGWIDFPASRNRKKEYYLDPKSNYWAVIPCTCGKGKEMPKGFSILLQERVKEWKIEQNRNKDTSRVPPLELKGRISKYLERYKTKEKDYEAERAKQLELLLGPNREEVPF